MPRNEKIGSSDKEAYFASTRGDEISRVSSRWSWTSRKSGSGLPRNEKFGRPKLSHPVVKLGLVRQKFCLRGTFYLYKEEVIFLMELDQLEFEGEGFLKVRKLASSSSKS